MCIIFSIYTDRSHIKSMLNVSHNAPNLRTLDWRLKKIVSDWAVGFKIQNGPFHEIMKSRGFSPIFMLQLYYFMTNFKTLGGFTGILGSFVIRTRVESKMEKMEKTFGKSRKI